MDDFVPLTPVNFFQFKLNCYYSEAPFSKLTPQKLSKFFLPTLAELCHENSFGKLAMGWNRDGIQIYVTVSQPFQRISYPEISRGDSLELFFDTRDVKTAGFATKFCHHFFFLPDSEDQISAGELTRFRTEDVHELCQGAALQVKSHKKSQGYDMQIFIPSHCLFGYDPDQFDRLGFTYKMNRADGSPQHFCVTSDDYAVEQNPALWSSLRLIK